LRIVTAEFGLHPLAIEDALHAHQRPKLDRYHSHLFVNTYAVEVADGGTVRTAEISAFVTPRALTTVRKEDFDIDGGLAMGSRTRTRRRGKDHLFAPERGFDLRRVVTPMHDVHLVTDALQPYYQDVNDHVQRAAENIDSARDLVANVLDANLTEQGTQLNEITQKLASWAAIIAVPTAVTAFYGQNVPFPGFGHHSGFVTSASVMVVLAVGVYLLLRCRGWL
jgi:magnesium transporter